VTKCKLCRHIMPTGRTCKSPAMRGNAYCYFHHPQRSSRSTPRVAELEFEIDPLIDPSSIVVIGEQILRAMAANRVSKSRAAVMFQGLQTIMASYRLPPAGGFDPNADLELDSAYEPGPEAPS
jgi:hypothetical protein